MGLGTGLGLGSAQKMGEKARRRSLDVVFYRVTVVVSRHRSSPCGGVRV